MLRLPKRVRRRWRNLTAVRAALRTRLLRLEQFESRRLLTIVTIPASADNTLFEESADESNGAGIYLFVGKTNGTQDPPASLRRAVVKFNVAGSVPAGLADQQRDAHAEHVADDFRRSEHCGCIACWPIGEKALPMRRCKRERAPRRRRMMPHGNTLFTTRPARRLRPSGPRRGASLRLPAPRHPFRVWEPIPGQAARWWPTSKAGSMLRPHSSAGC